MGYRPEAIYLTHYSRVTDLKRLAQNLHTDLDAFVAIAKCSAHNPDRLVAIKSRLRAYLYGRLDTHGFLGDEGHRDELLEMDIELNAKGLIVWLDRQAK